MVAIRFSLSPAVLVVVLKNCLLKEPTSSLWFQESREGPLATGEGWGVGGGGGGWGRWSYLFKQNNSLQFCHLESAVFGKVHFSVALALREKHQERIRQKILPFSSSLFALLVMYLFILVHIAPSLTWFMILRLDTDVFGFFLFWNGLISSCSHTPYQRSQAVSNPQTARKKPTEDWSCELTIQCTYHL